jgi:hypothetical protein
MGRRFSRSSARSSTPHKNNPGYAARAPIEHKRACADIMAIAEEYARINPPAPPFKCVCGAETNNPADPESCACTCLSGSKQGTAADHLMTEDSACEAVG